MLALATGCDQEDKTVDHVLHVLLLFLSNLNLLHVSQLFADLSPCQEFLLRFHIKRWAKRRSQTACSIFMGQYQTGLLRPMCRLFLAHNSPFSRSRCLDLVRIHRRFLPERVWFPLVLQFPKCTVVQVIRMAGFLLHSFQRLFLIQFRYVFFRFHRKNYYLLQISRNSWSYTVYFRMKPSRNNATCTPYLIITRWHIIPVPVPLL